MDKLTQILTAVKHRVTDLRPAFRNIADNFNQVEKEAFEQGGRKRKWRALSPAYAAWKAKKYPGRPILVRTGDLRDSLAGQTSNSVRKIKRKEMEMGTKLDYASYHDTGTSNMPKRPPIDPKKSDTNEWVFIMRRYILEKLGLRADRRL